MTTLPPSPAVLSKLRNFDQVDLTRSEAEIYFLILAGEASRSDDLGRFDSSDAASFPELTRAGVERVKRSLLAADLLRSWKAGGQTVMEVEGGCTCGVDSSEIEKDRKQKAVFNAKFGKKKGPQPKTAFIRSSLPGPPGRPAELTLLPPSGANVRLCPSIGVYDDLTKMETIVRFLLERGSDDYGRCQVRPDTLRTALTYRFMRPYLIDAALKGLEEKDHIKRYTVGDREYALVRDCAQHAKERKRYDSSIPKHPDYPADATFDSPAYLAYFEQRGQTRLGHSIIKMNNQDQTVMEAARQFLQKYTQFRVQLPLDPFIIDRNIRVSDGVKFYHAVTRGDYRRADDLYRNFKPPTKEDAYRAHLMDLKTPEFDRVLEFLTRKSVDQWAQLSAERRDAQPEAVQPQLPAISSEAFPVGSEVEEMRRIGPFLILPEREARKMMGIVDYVPTDTEIQECLVYHVKKVLCNCLQLKEGDTQPDLVKRKKDLANCIDADTRCRNRSATFIGLSYQAMLSFYRMVEHDERDVEKILEALKLVDTRDSYHTYLRKEYDAHLAYNPVVVPFDFKEFFAAV